MSEHHVGKVTEVVGTSPTSIEDAINTALERTSKTVKNLQWFHVSEIRGALTEDGQVERYQVMMRIGFGLNDD